MKDQNIMDERILFERREIQSRGYAWLVILLLISVVIQQFFLNAPFAQYAVEFFLMIGCGVYNIISNYSKGIDIWNTHGNGKRKLFISTVITGLATIILLAVLSGNYQIKQLGAYFIGFVLFMYSVRLIMVRLNHKKQQAIDQELGDEE